MTLTQLSQLPPSTVRPFAPFHATVTTEHGRTVVALHGEADLCTLDALAGVLAHVIAEHSGPVVVDLERAAFTDLGTVRALGRASLLLAAVGREMTIRGARPMAIFLLGFLGVSHLLAPDGPGARN